MSTIKFIVDWAPRNYAACVDDDRMACVATGKTLDDVKFNIVDALKFHIEGMQLDGDPVPPEYLEEWTQEFHLTICAQLHYAGTYITRKALARETGINEAQLCHYANGRKKPRPNTRRKILDGIQAISERLTTIL